MEKRLASESGHFHRWWSAAPLLSHRALSMIRDDANNRNKSMAMLRPERPGDHAR